MAADAEPGRRRARRVPSALTRFAAALLAAMPCAAPLRAAPPFEGTVFAFPDLVSVDGPTALVGLDGAGTGVRRMFDRRRDAFVDVEAHLFVARFDDLEPVEVRVNAEFGSEAAARDVAEFHARSIGRIPRALRSELRTVSIHRGDEAFGGGDGDLLFHTGRIAQDYLARGVFEEAIMHEAAHVSLDARIGESSAWKAAQARDGDHISDYARDFPQREDVAETVVAWFALRYASDALDTAIRQRIVAATSHRLAVLDALGLSTYPSFRASPDVDHSGAWQRADEPGWGLNLVRGASGRYAMHFCHYDVDGSPMWLLGAAAESDGALAAPLFRYAGTPLNAGPFDPGRVRTSEVGWMRVVFVAADLADLEYRVDDAVRRVRLRRLEF